MAPNKAAALSALLQQQQCQAIYVALDGGNPRQAVQQADHVLRNNSAASSHTLARALKALALYRSRSESEAIAEVEAVLAHMNPAACDQSVLTPLTFVLSRTGRRAKAADLLDTASKARPDDHDVSVKAFEALIGSKEYLRAQQLGTRMHKAFGGPVSAVQSKKNGKQTTLGNPDCSSARNRYFWWSMQAYLLLSVETPQAQGAALALALAERMIQKHVSAEEGKFDEQSHEDIELYISVLLAQADKLTKDDERTKKRQDALQLLLNEPGSHIAKKSLGLGQLKLDLLKQTADWVKLEEESRNLIQEGDRNWMTIEKWIEGVTGLAERDFDVIDRATKMADELAAKDGKRRDYPLLRLALHHELRKKAKLLQSGAFVDLIESYYDTFGSKLCCYEDLLPFLDALQPEEADKLAASENIRFFDPSSSSSSDPTFATEEDVIKSLNAAKIRVRLTSPSSEGGTDVDEQIEQLLKAFYASLPISAKVPKTVPRAGTDFVLIAAQLILADQGGEHSSVLIHLASILTHAANATPASYALKVLCLRIYLMLGCQREARKLWTDLKIRGIQNESLGWLWVGRSLEGGSSEEGAPVSQWRREASNLYGEVEGEQLRMVMTAFERGNYSSVREFMEFEHRMERSTQRQLIQLERARQLSQIAKNREGRQKAAAAVLQEAEQVLKEGLLQQWDDAILPSFCNKALDSFVDLTSRDHIFGLHDTALFIRRQARYLAVLADGPGVAIPEGLKDPSSAPAQDWYTLESYANGIVEAFASGSAAQGQEALQALLEEVQASHCNMLPWQEQYNVGILLDLYLLYWHFLNDGSSSSSKGEGKTVSPAALKEGLDMLRTALNERVTTLKQARPLTLSIEPHQSSEEDGASEGDDGLTSLVRTLENALDAQKGGKGTREKVFKDVKDEVARMRKATVLRVQETLRDFP
ncbi:hypothetical protein BCV69DRAFT_279636 [Microstroma glucosiphilum]|uniref:Actin cytoskeleton organization protein n=1 Tax=Pseudomicrostroma glucosiphilum TaxID=1684307 RepID=A0A316UER4_9BASI|nr:hypothetical protein BCV69DRAFT_279636 [Pseudomicrostroma glucosiphilum]PWN23712.1 hypothetical protein BCV69DRAFT_279636 [Pseudomicrostroma glucosiphilum]